MTSISQCIVCHKKHFELQSMQQASASGLPLFSLFERILGFSLEPELLLHNVVCPECVNRFYDYDAAFQRAERAASELIELFGNKVIDPFSYEYTIHVKPEDLADVNIEVQVKNVDNKSIEWSIGPPLSLDVSRETAMSERKENKQKVGRPSHFPCQKCSRKFRSSDSLADHECIVNARPFVCDICGLTYKTKGSLATHMIIHSGIRRHSCEICGKAFTQRIALARHISIHTGQMNYQVKNTHHIYLTLLYLLFVITVRYMRQTVHPLFFVPYA